MKKAAFLIILFSLLGCDIRAQCNVQPAPPLTFVNPSFEGPSCAGCQPPPWVDCGGTPDTQPGSWGFTQPASDGGAYVSFLQDGANANGYYEGSSQQLSSCMTAGQVYSFSVDLAHSDVYNTAGPGNCYSSLEIWGSGSLCNQGELLWQSGPITHTNWQTYTVSLTPTSNWCFVSFRPYWISGCGGYVNIMVDNLGPMQTDSPGVEATVSSSISCSQDISGTTSCPSDSVIITGLFNGSPLYATMLTDTTWQANINYPVGSPASQQINMTAYLTSGILLNDSIIFNLVDITPEFSFTSACIGNPTLFSDSTVASSGTITNWTWDFGDGSPLNNSQNPSHTYTNSGSYNVLLLVNTSDGCMDTVSRWVNVNSKPVAGFTPTNVCVGDSTYFTNTSFVNAPASITGYLWNFGDGSPTSSVQSPAHLYTSAGTYTVSLITNTQNSCSDTVSVTVNVTDKPNTAFSVNNSCLSDSAGFVNTSANPPTGSITGWSWDFGDGSPINTNAWNPNHLYTASGNYEVTLITYTSSQGCADTLKDSLTIFPLPVVNFGVTEVCQGTVTDFHDSSAVSLGSITGWNWNFGIGPASSALQHPLYTYTAFGTYTASLIVTTNNGCIDSISKSVTIHPPPVADFITDNVCDQSSVPFDNSSVMPTNLTNDVIQAWTWTFGDGSANTTSQNTSHQYTGPGSYSVRLVVVSDFGCADSISKTVTVNPLPVVNFTASDTLGCEPHCITFLSSSSVPAGIVATQLWSFGDNTPNAISQDIQHCYYNDSLLQPVSFSPVLTVTSDSGCVSILTKTNYITVFPAPEAQFITSPEVANSTSPDISIVNTSTGATLWSWNFGDSGTATIRDPLTHTYPDTGSYLITLIASTQFNCADTAYQTIIIEPDFIFYIPNAFTPDNDGLNDSFTGKGIYILEFDMMIFDRWGNLVYKTNDIDKPWDGKANFGTEIAQPDVYVYSINIRDFKRTKHTYRGTVTLVR